VSRAVRTSTEPVQAAARPRERVQISVCVSTRGRARLLPRLIDALECQTLDRSKFEVVITDDGSSDETWEVLRNLASRTSFLMRTARNEVPGGPGAGRNRAWQAARAPLVAFTDDDCVPTPTWLEAHLFALRRSDITQGAVKGDPSQIGNLGPFSRVVGVPDENGLYETCNVCYRREWLVKLGGFDTRFRRSGEDADLAWRAKELGASTTFVEDALVHHDVESSSWRRALRDTLRWTGVVLLVDRHPHLRSRFGEGATWRRAHLPAALAGLGMFGAALALVGHRPVLVYAATVAAAPYVRHRLFVEPISEPRVSRFRLLLPQLILDLSELGVIVSTRAQLKYRKFQAEVPALRGYHRRGVA
jgi:GT2 family glycosyltransferase